MNLGQIENTAAPEYETGFNSNIPTGALFGPEYLHEFLLRVRILIIIGIPSPGLTRLIDALTSYCGYRACVIKQDLSAQSVRSCLKDALFNNITSSTKPYKSARVIVSGTIFESKTRRMVFQALDDLSVDSYRRGIIAIEIPPAELLTEFDESGNLEDVIRLLDKDIRKSSPIKLSERRKMQINREQILTIRSVQQLEIVEAIIKRTLQMLLSCVLTE